MLCLCDRICTGKAKKCLCVSRSVRLQALASMGGGAVSEVPPASTGTVSFDNDYGASAQETAAAAMLEGARKDK